MAAQKAISLLIVDDDKWVTRAIAELVTNDPFMVVLDSVHSGEAAYEAYRALRPDVVLMDINLGAGMSGVDATAKIRRHNPNACVVMLTTVAPGPGLVRALEAGAVAALSKSAPESVLLKTIEIVAQGEDPWLLKDLAQDILVSGLDADMQLPQAPRLTQTERDVLTLVCSGKSYEEIAYAQGTSLWTARTHVKSLRDKLGAENLAQVVVRAMQLKFFTG